MKSLRLSKNKYTIVDKEDFEKLNRHKWCVSSGGYAVRISGGKMIMMHRIIMKTPKGLDTDHVNSNKLDNRRKNLRVCTRSQNMANMNRTAGNKSGYKGVSWKESHKKWRANIRKGGVQVHLGYFDYPKMAAKVYNKAAVIYYGDFANLNRI